MEFVEVKGEWRFMEVKGEWSLWRLMENRVYGG